MAPQLDLEAVEKWLYLLHGDCPGYSVVSHPGNWSGRAVSVSSDDWPDQLLGYVARTDRSQPKGIYLRVTTVNSPPAEGRRGFTKDSIALPALWLDMDIAGPGHKPILPTQANPNPLPLPPDENTCLEIIGAADVPEPTLWVHSGGGLYPMWFFKQPIILDGEEDVDTWNDRSRRLHERVHEAAKTLGWHYGLGTHDLARVLRIPGTVNYKVPGAPTQARIYEEFEGQGLTFTAEELNFPEVPKPVRELPSSTPTMSTGINQTGRSPVDHYNQAGEVLDLLRHHGWEVASKRGPEWMLVRPGKALRDGPSASWGYGGSRNLYVWSTDAGLPVQEPLSPFFLLAHYEHGGDMSAASGHLRREGWGDPLPVQDRGAAEAADRNTILGTITPPPSPPTGGDDGVEGSGGGDQRPRINMGNENFAVQDILRAFGTGTTAMFFLQNNKLRMIPACDETGPRLYNPEYFNEEVDSNNFRSLLSERFHLYRIKDGEEVPASPTVGFGNMIHAAIRAGRAPKLRTFNGLVRRPIVQPDGSVCDVAGFNNATRLVYVPDPELNIPAIPANPTAEHVEAARELLNYMIADFPFVSEDDRNNYLGLLFTPMLMSMIKTDIKLGLIYAHQPGTGKSLLAKIIKAVHGAAWRTAIRNTQGADEEYRKVITSSLRDPEPAVVFDNMTGTIDFVSINALATSRTWVDRGLGGNTNFSAPNNKLWMFTGNNVAVGKDTVRRTLWVSIDAGMPHPEERSHFAIKGLTGWVEENKGSILWSLYTILQAWNQAGKPKLCLDNSDFCGWSSVINGLLQVGGWSGTFDSKATRLQKDSHEGDEMAQLFEAAYDQFGTNGWYARDLVRLINPNEMPKAGHPISSDVLPIELLKELRAGEEGVVVRKLGAILREQMGTFHGKFRVHRSDRRAEGGFKWTIHLQEELPTSEQSAEPTAASTTPTPESAMQRIARLTGPAAPDRTDQAVNPTPVDVSHPGEPEQPELSGLHPVPDVVPDGHPPGPPTPYLTSGPASSPPEP